MKIYSRQSFLRLPEGTFFAKGVKWNMDGFCLKLETFYDDDNRPMDFCYINLVSVDGRCSDELFERMEEMLEKGASYPLDESTSRDGCFAEEDIFLVFEISDLKKIKEIMDHYAK